MSLSDQSQQSYPTNVQVTVLQARSLRIKGKNGTNDAYAIMQVAKDKFATSVAEKSVAPLWKEEATFVLPLFHNSNTEKCTLHVHVMHRALVGPDKLLGHAVINLLELSEVKSRNKTEWHKLLDKAGKPDKDRGEVLVDIQFMKNNLTASMFDLSATDKPRSRMGKFKDKVRGKKEGLSDSASAVVPSFTQVLTDSEGEGEEKGGADKEEKKKKNKLKSLFSPKSNLQRHGLSQSMSVLGPLPEKNSSLSYSRSSGLNVDSSEGKSKLKFLTHKRTGSSDSKASQGSLSLGRSKIPAPLAEQSNLCINGSHVYTEEPQPRSARTGSTFSLTSSGHGSMEDLRRAQDRKSSSTSMDSVTALKQPSPWAEAESSRAEEEEEEEEERVKMDKERKRKEEQERKKERMRKEEAEKRRFEEEEEEESIRIEEEKIRFEEEGRKEEQENRKRMEEENIRVEEESRMMEEEERKRRLKEEGEERVKKQEQEILRLQEEMEEQERWEEEERMRREEHERMKREDRLRKEEERKMREVEERLKREKEERIKDEQERIRREQEEDMQRREERERKMRQEEEQVRKEEEIRREEERMKREQDRLRKEEGRMREEEERKAEEEERLREEMGIKRTEEEKRIKREEGDRLRKEEEEKKIREEEEMLRREEEDDMQRKEEEQRKIREEEERIRRLEEERLRKEEAEGMMLEEEEERENEQERRRDEEQRKLIETKKRFRVEEENMKRDEERMREEEKRRNAQMEEEKRHEEESVPLEEVEKPMEQNSEAKAIVCNSSFEEVSPTSSLDDTSSNNLFEENPMTSTGPISCRINKVSAVKPRPSSWGNPSKPVKSSNPLLSSSSPELESSMDSPRGDRETRDYIDPSTDLMEKKDCAPLALNFQRWARKDNWSSKAKSHCATPNLAKTKPTKLPPPVRRHSSTSLVGSGDDQGSVSGKDHSCIRQDKGPAPKPPDSQRWARKDNWPSKSNPDSATSTLTQKKPEKRHPPPRRHSATSLVGSEHDQNLNESVSQDDSNVRRDKRPAPLPPDRPSQALSQTQRDQSMTSVNLGHKDRVGASMSKVSQRVVQMITPLRSSSTATTEHISGGQSSTHHGNQAEEPMPSATEGLIVAKHNKGQAPSRPQHPPGKTMPKADVLDEQSNAEEHEPSVEFDQNNPFAEDCRMESSGRAEEQSLAGECQESLDSHNQQSCTYKDADLGQFQKSVVGDTTELPTPDVLPAEDGSCPTKRTSAKRVRAPLPPVKKTSTFREEGTGKQSSGKLQSPGAPTSSKLSSVISGKTQNGGVGVALPYVTVDQPPCVPSLSHPEPLKRSGGRRDCPPQTTSSAPGQKTLLHAGALPFIAEQCSGEEAGGRGDRPASSTRRSHPVKPLRSLENQPASNIHEGQAGKSTGILGGLHEKIKVKDTGVKGPYSQLTQEELISLVLKQQEQLSKREDKIKELEQYIDNLLVRIIEEQPSILMSLNSLK